MTVKLDLHVHSESRSRVFINDGQLRDSLRYKNLDGVAITNFFSISHALWLKERIKDYIIIVGQEICTLDGHIVGLGLRERVKDFQKAEETIQQIHEQGGIAVAVHPYTYLGLGKKIMDLPVDAIEVYNGFAGKLFIQNYLAERLAQDLRVPQLASSDTTSSIFIGQSYTEVLTSDGRGISESIRLGKVRLFKRALPFPFAFFLKGLLGFRELEPCLIHAVPCSVCGKSMAIRLFKRRLKCIDCGKEIYSRILCCNGHFLCIDCICRRATG